MYYSKKLLNKTYYKLATSGTTFLEEDDTKYVKADPIIPKWKFTFDKNKSNISKLKYGNFTFRLYTPFMIFRKTEGSIDFSIKLPTNKDIVEEHLVGDVHHNSEWHFSWFSIIGAGSKGQYFTKYGKLMTEGFSCS